MRDCPERPKGRGKPAVPWSKPSRSRRQALVRKPLVDHYFFPGRPRVRECTKVAAVRQVAGGWPCCLIRCACVCMPFGRIISLERLYLGDGVRPGEASSPEPLDADGSYPALG